jgi:MHS family proline/betaine transporter-like MFS transporter
VSITLRIGLPETPDFEQSHEPQSHPKPVGSIFTEPKILKNLLLTIILSGSWGIFYQILFIWMPTYLHRFQHLNNDITLRINSIALFIFAFLILGVGYFADRINRNFLLIISCMAMLVLAHPLFLLLASGDLYKIYAAMFTFTIIFSVFLPVAFITMVEMFDAHIRYTGLSLGFNTGLAIFGGTCPLVVTWLIEITGNNTAPAFYVMVAAAASLLISFMLTDKRKNISTFQLPKLLSRMLPFPRKGGSLLDGVPPSGE